MLIWNFTSANSINVARFLPQAFIISMLMRSWKDFRTAAANMVVSVPSGNWKHHSRTFAKRMGLPVKRFIAANNRNDIFLEYLKTGEYKPRPSVATIANAMDVGDPSNFARILDLYGHSHEAISAEISGVSYNDEQIADTMRNCKPVIYSIRMVLVVIRLSGWTERRWGGVFLETAHPAKFLDTVQDILGEKVEILKNCRNLWKAKSKVSLWLKILLTSKLIWCREINL